MSNNSQFSLPKQRRYSLVERIYNYGTRKLLLLGFAAYFIPVIVVSLVESGLHPEQHFVKNPAVGPCDLLYFNFVSMLTIGYGDLSPTGFFAGLR